MNTFDVTSNGVTTEHLAKQAYIYIRQSSLAQVSRHGESTDLQYQLVERARQLGWPPGRIQVIGEDLGKSGASSEDRSGFQHLIAEVGLARVGLVVSLDASRLARNNRDWYQLLELCSVFGTLIADRERLYNPGLYQDRMLLGLSGMMSEAELHQLRLRLQAGAMNKAKRGELQLPLPVGLVRLPEGEVILNPDEEVQQRIRLVFEKFRELGSARAVMRYLRAEGLPLPTRPLRGPAPHPTCWGAPSISRVTAILKNPAYAGAYVYGRLTTDPARRRPGHRSSGIIRRPIDQWPVLLQEIYPAYISWEEYLKNQQQLSDNQNRYEAGNHGVPRKGDALLQGIIRCGRCGASMYVRYSGPQGEYPVYICKYAYKQYGAPLCQEIRALPLDEQIERLVLEALAPDRIELALEALQELEHEQEVLNKQWQLRLERARYEAERAKRQYDAVEPENRLVARTLERRWEQQLRAVEQLEQDYHRWQESHRLELGASDRQAIQTLGEDLPALWSAPTTGPADRKRIVRLTIQEVVANQHGLEGKVYFKVIWQTGAVSEHEYNRAVRSYREHPQREALIQRVRELHAQEKMDEQIAEALGREGFRAARGGAFYGELVWLFRQQLGLPAVHPKRATRMRWEDGSYTVEGAAEVLGVFPGTVYKWLKTGKMKGGQLAKGTPWRIELPEEEIPRWHAYIKRVRRLKKEAS